MKKKVKTFCMAAVGIALLAPVVGSAGGMGMGSRGPDYTRGGPAGWGQNPAGPVGQPWDNTRRGGMGMGRGAPAGPGARQWGAPRGGDMNMNRGPGGSDMARRGGMGMGRNVPARPGGQQWDVPRRGGVGMGRGPGGRGMYPGYGPAGAAYPQRGRLPGYR